MWVWGIKVLFGEENEAWPVECPVLLVFWNAKFKSCLHIKYMVIRVNSAILRDASCLHTLNPTEKRGFGIEDGCKMASVNSHEHCTPAQSTWTRVWEAKPNLKIYFTEFANCHHYNVLWQPSYNLKKQFRPGELLWHATIIWEITCDCTGFLRTETGFISGLFFLSICESSWFSLVQGLMGGFFECVFGDTLCLLTLLTSCT